MLWLYRFLFAPALLLLAPYYLARMRKRGGYRTGFAQRFGFPPSLPPRRSATPRLWVQAVSVGEMLAIAPLLRAFHARGWEVYLTTTTSTGYALAREKYADLTVGIGYFPLDFWPCSARTWARVAPTLAVLTEGERWPEHLAQAAARGCPVVAVNARLSDRSFHRMRAWRAVIQPLLQPITEVLACAAVDRDRFLALGFSSAAVHVVGNLKLDLSVPQLSEEQRLRLRQELGLGTGPVLLGSSTWPGEEKALLDAFAQLRERDPSAKLLLVPRHAERRQELAAVLAATPFSHHFRSRGLAAGEVDVAVGDTTGELRAFTQLASVVVVGKSFPPHSEGQTPVEAAALGRALVTGPGMSNFRAIMEELQAADAVVRATPESLVADILTLWENAERRSALGTRAQRWLQANQGAVGRTVEHLERVLTSARPPAAV